MNASARQVTSLRRRQLGQHGQWFVEYLVLVGAVAVAVMAVANLAHRAFVGRAQAIETATRVF